MTVREKWTITYVFLFLHGMHYHRNPSTPCSNSNKNLLASLSANVVATFLRSSWIGLLQHWNSKIWFLKKKFIIEFWLVLKSWNHLSFVNISSTVVNDTSLERFSWVLQHGNPKVWFFKESLKLNFDFLCWRAEINIQVARSQHAPIWWHWGCIIVPSNVLLCLYIVFIIN